MQTPRRGLADILQAITNAKHIKAIDGPQEHRSVGTIVARLAEAYTDEIREHSLERKNWVEPAPKRRGRPRKAASG